MQFRASELEVQLEEREKAAALVARWVPTLAAMPRVASPLSELRVALHHAAQDLCGDDEARRARVDRGVAGE